MKTYNHLFDKIVSFENLLLAAQRASQGKKQKPNVMRFNFALEDNL